MDDLVGNDLMPTNVTESKPIQNKECEKSLKASSSKMLDQLEMVTPCSEDHHESSSHLYTYMDEKSLDRVYSSEQASASPRCMDEAGIMVEELTLRNYTSENIAIVGTSTNRDRTQNRQKPWQHLYQMAGEAGSEHVAGKAAPTDRGRSTTTTWDDTENTIFPGFWNQTHKSPNDDAAIDPKPVTDGNIVLHNESIPNGGIRTKILSSSGFSEYFIRSTLKGKGITCKGPAHQGLARECNSQLQMKSTNVPAKVSDVRLTSAAKTILAPLPEYPETLCSLHTTALTGEISLREWLNGGLKGVNKFESLRIFRQIVELVDISHSQGVILQTLRPSCFKMAQFNQVIYIGPSVREEMKEDAAIQGFPKSCIDKRRHFEQNVVSLVNSARKKQRYSEGMKFSQMSPRESTVDVSLLQSAGSKEFRHGCDYEHDIKSKFQAEIPDVSIVSCVLEEKWYTSPEQFNGRACTFASNIYSLGVLLFELLGSFDSGKLHSAAMLDLRYRILPPDFLQEHPREAGFCLWLLHPEPSSRPATRDILRSEVIAPREEVEVIAPREEVSGDKLWPSISEGDADSELLLHFLTSLKDNKEKDASTLMAEIGCIESDLQEVEKRQLKTLPVLASYCPEFVPRSESADAEPASSVLRSKCLPIGDKETRFIGNIKQLESAYFSTRTNAHLANDNLMLRSNIEMLKSRENERMVEKKFNTMDRLGCFYDGLCKYARYTKFKQCGLVRNADFSNSANVICSLSFDRDEDYLAAGGVSKKIKIFEFQALLDDSVDIHYPVIEIPNRSKLSCLCWNSYIRNYLASTDYDGLVKTWDASTGQAFTQFAEHTERAWSVDFSRIDPTKLVSGSDDCLVKLWSLNERNSLCTIKNNANVCCVQFSADSAHSLVFSSADYKTYCYDLRNTSSPWCILAGHDKAVSYAKFLDSETVITASTDNTLKIWDLNRTTSSGLQTNACALTLRGHTNEKNFVGLSIADGYIVCGSETNEVYAYYKSLPMPITSYKFGSIDPITAKETDDDNGQFVSSVCWRRKSDMVVAANSSGCIKLLQMV
ncbi:hypothetical protein LIER_09239 [Lithospermum erythrorhizon]|uniref:Protein SPA1-RELATED 2 n=1 Tax=Lithospermum erythrorhizon TaxID=34254 RepID=A0AAV3PIV0_LITER